MPTCPGCSRTVTYRELKGHVSHCKWLWSEEPEAETRWAQHLAERLRRLDERTPTQSRLARVEERVRRMRDR